jgi:hypothetical protein
VAACCGLGAPDISTALTTEPKASDITIKSDNLAYFVKSMRLSIATRYYGLMQRPMRTILHIGSNIHTPARTQRYPRIANLSPYSRFAYGIPQLLIELYKAVAND